MRAEVFRPALPLVKAAGVLFVLTQVASVLAGFTLASGDENAPGLIIFPGLLGLAAVITAFVAVLRLVSNLDEVTYFSFAQQREKRESALKDISSI